MANRFWIAKTHSKMAPTKTNEINTENFAGKEQKLKHRTNIQIRKTTNPMRRQ